MSDHNLVEKTHCIIPESERKKERGGREDGGGGEGGREKEEESTLGTHTHNIHVHCTRRNDKLLTGPFG